MSRITSNFQLICLHRSNFLDLLRLKNKIGLLRVISHSIMQIDNPIFIFCFECLLNKFINADNVKFFSVNRD